MTSSQETIVVPGRSVPTQWWWPALHSTIIAAFQRKDIQAFPPTWTRLNPDAATGAEGLADELGPHGQLVVIFEDKNPIACSGVLPFRGEDWTKDVRSADSEAEVANGEITKSIPHAADDESDVVTKDWEICCFCVHPNHRGQGLARQLLDTVLSTIMRTGAKRLIANYSLEETGAFWPRMGFTQPIGTGSVLKKGFTHTAGMEGLRDDIHFKMTAKNVE